MATGKTMLGGREIQFLTSRKLPPNVIGFLPPNGFDEVSPVYLAFLDSYRPRGATIARSRALRRWRVACHRARKGLARSFPVTTGFGLAPVNGGIRRRLNPSL